VRLDGECVAATEAPAEVDCRLLEERARDFIDRFRVAAAVRLEERECAVPMRVST